jgi:hypothetical protein
MIVGHAKNHGNRNHLWLLVRRPTTAEILLKADNLQKRQFKARPD